LALRIDVVGLAAGRQALATIDDDPAIGHGDDLWRADDLGDIADDFVQEPVQGRAELVAAGAEAAGIGPPHGAGGRFDQGVAHRGTGRCRDLAVGFTRQVDEFFLDLGGYAGLRQVDDQHEIGAQRLAELATLFVGGLIAFEQAQLLADGAVVAAIQHGEAAALDELVGQRLAQLVGVGALAQSSGGDDGDAVALGLWRLGLELDLFDRHFQVDLAALVFAGLPDDLVALDLALAGHAVLAADAGFERGARGPRAFDVCAAAGSLGRALAGRLELAFGIQAAVAGGDFAFAGFLDRKRGLGARRPGGNLRARDLAHRVAQRGFDGLLIGVAVAVGLHGDFRRLLCLAGERPGQRQAQCQKRRSLHRGSPADGAVVPAFHDGVFAFPVGQAVVQIGHGQLEVVIDLLGAAADAIVALDDLAREREIGSNHPAVFLDGALVDHLR